MIRLLKTPFTITLNNNVRVIGGTGALDHATTERCLQRMQNWVYLTFNTVDAECPHFETIQSYGVFRCTTSKYGGIADPMPQLLKIKNTYGITHSIDEIVDQYRHFKPIADTMAEQEGLDSKEAWMKALDQVSRSSSTRSSHPFDAIEQVLVRHWGSALSSSGVEQTFAKQHGASGDYMGSLCDAHIDDRTEIFDITPAVLSEVLELAKKEWAEVYGCTRVSGGNKRRRLDTGSAKRRKRLASSAKVNGFKTVDKLLKMQPLRRIAHAQIDRLRSSPP